MDKLTKKIDFDYVERLGNGNLKIIEDFIKIFEKEVLSGTLKMKKAFSKKDYQLLGQTAHRLNSCAKTLKLVCSEKLESYQENPKLLTMEKINEIDFYFMDAIDQLKIRFQKIT